jgi:hypothetical protein
MKAQEQNQLVQTEIGRRKAQGGVVGEMVYMLVVGEMVYMLINQCHLYQVE